MAPSIDLIVRGGTVVGADGRRRADLAVAGGRVVAVEDELSLPARDVVDATGLLVLPGAIDVHLHFNEPGHDAWEGAATGSRALAAGGGTLFFDMPLNSLPCTVNAREVDRKRAALEASSIVDFGLWGGLVPGSVPEMAGMAARGVVGFKAFMCDSGLPEFPRVDDETLLAGMREAARLGLPVAVHAEREEAVRVAAGAWNGPGARAFLASRPIEAELEAVRTALDLARESGAKLHIVHMSSGRAVTLAVEARLTGTDVSIETCPHYLTFTDADVERLGVVLKCAPPLRPAHEQDLLWRHVLDGDVDIVASDHSPCEPAMKVAGDFRRSWGGIAGVQSTLSVLLEEGVARRRLALERVVSLVAARPAERFRIGAKGSLAAGRDADMVLLDPAAAGELDAPRLLQRHRMSPYVGRRFTGVIRRTIRRGETIYADGRIVAQSTGSFVCPS